MRRLLFICTGNTCRSPMAEVLASSILEKQGKSVCWETASAGIAAFPGDEATTEARAVMAQRGLDLSRHRSRRVTVYDVEEAHLVLTMTMAQREALRRLFPDFTSRIRLLAEVACNEAAASLQKYDELRADGDFRQAAAVAALLEPHEIPDPIGEEVSAYEAVAEKLEKMLFLLLENLSAGKDSDAWGRKG